MLSLIIISVLLLPTAGIYALMSFTVSQRRRNWHSRGDGRRFRAAAPQHLFESGDAVGPGVVVGVGAAAFFDAVSGGELLGSIGRPLLPAMSIVMIAVGLIAAIGPARRGLRIQPTEALRAE